MRKVILFAAMCLLLCSCNAIQEHTGQLFAMDTVMDYKIYTNNNELPSLVEDEIKRIETLLDRGTDGSFIYELNHTKKGKPSDEILYILKEASEISDMTDGAFDATVAPVMDLWGFYTKNFHVPTDEELNDALSGVDYNKIEITPEKIVLPENTSIDLGGIAKGYTSDRISDILKNAGVKSAIISLGGNVCAIGKKIDGTDWTVGIANPNEPSDIICKMKVRDKSVITSGAYQRYFEQDGKIYHHIIDPKTGKNSDNSLASVTVVSDNGTLADALSTAIFVLGLDKGTEIWKDNDFFDVVFIEKDGSIYITDGLKDTFSADCEYEIIER